MSQPESPSLSSVGTAPPSESSQSDYERALNTRIDRFRTLTSAWKALKTSGLSPSSMHLGETCAELRDDLNAIASTAVEADGISRLDESLDDFERGMRDVACSIPVSTLRARLPHAVKRDRASFLELLDVMLLSDSTAHDGELGSRLSAVDYLITLLCTDGSSEAPTIQHDPVTLTPKLRLLCESTAATGEPDHAHAEGNFYSAAQTAPTSDSDKSELKRQKAELGREFFAPRILRAITTYNASQLAPPPAPAVVQAQRPAQAPPPRHAQPAAQAPAPVQTSPPKEAPTPSVALPPPNANKADSPDPNASVFETTALLPLIEALRRRVKGAKQSASPVDRVVWSLDLDFATPSETAIMLEASGPSAESPAGAAVLVGLLCRSINVLGDKLLAVEISPDVLSGTWATELSDAIKVDVNRRIVENGYIEACALSDLRSKFLDFSGRRAPEGWRPNAPETRPVDDKRAMRKAASQLATEALESPATAVAEQPNPRATDAIRSRLLKIAGASAAGLALVAALLFQVSALPEGRTALASGELKQVSEHLVSAQRDGHGTGPSLVGTLDESWELLGASERHASAFEIVAALRLLGARNIMIYDAAGRVRVQALGEDNVQVPAVDAPTN